VRLAGAGMGADEGLDISLPLGVGVQLALLSGACNDLVISGGALGWWSAYLSPRGKVFYAPEYVEAAGSAGSAGSAEYCRGDSRAGHLREAGGSKREVVTGGLLPRGLECSADRVRQQTDRFLVGTADTELTQQ